MDVDYALVADYAEIVGGKLYVMGGGWDTTYVPEVPAMLRLAIAVGIRVGWTETGRNVPVRIVVEDDDGQVLVTIDAGVTVGRPASLLPGTPQLTQMAANVAFSAPAFGGYRVLVNAGEDEMVASRSLPFRVAPKVG